MVDPAQAAWLVRVTARISATLFAASLVVACARIRDNRFRSADLGVFGALVVSHTIHFFCVGLLAIATSGGNIRTRGGWMANVVIAALFYTGCIVILRAKRRPTPAWPTVRARRTEVWVLAAIGLAFAQAYIIRLTESWLFAALAVWLLGSLIWFLRRATRVAFTT
jgi:hypothetical protein